MVVCNHPHVSDRLLAFPEIGVKDCSADGWLAASVLTMLEAPAGGIQLARYNESDLSTLPRLCTEERLPD